MTQKILDRISFWSLFLVIVLLPIFFLPFTKVPTEISKGLLLVVGLTVSTVFWLAARFSSGRISIPKSRVLFIGFCIVLSFLVSALFSGAKNVSLFGVIFDLGTFWYILAAYLLMFLSSVILKERKSAKIVLIGTLFSFVLVSIFQILHLFMPNTLSLGILSGKTDSILGAWNSLGLFSGFAGMVSLFVLEFFSVPNRSKIILRVLVVLSMLMVAIVNFYLVWVLLGLFALVMFVYKISVNSGNSEENKERFPVASLAVVMVSLLFFMGSQSIGTYLPSRLGLSNIEVGPSISATMSVTKQTLAKDPIFGVGPNRFAESWAMYKPTSINSTSFWDISFGTGFGLLPTFGATTGIVGIIVWLLFLFFFVVSGFKYLFHSERNDTNREITLFFMAALFLIVSAFFYASGSVILLLAFAFTGIFIGLAFTHRENGEMAIMLLSNAKKSFISTLLLVLVMIATAAVSFKYMERFISFTYFSKALTASDVPAAEVAINKAVSLYSNDLYLRTFAQLYLIKLNNLASKGTALSEAEKAELQDSLDKAVKSAQLAIAFNKSNYLNHRMLGSVYETVIPLGVPGAYDGAIAAYREAGTLNPLNPSLKLILSRVSIASNKIEDAKNYANQALALKADYVDAYVFLAQIAKNEGNTSSAISYAEKALKIAPSNKDLIQYVNSLKGISGN